MLHLGNTVEGGRYYYIMITYVASVSRVFLF